MKKYKYISIEYQYMLSLLISTIYGMLWLTVYELTGKALPMLFESAYITFIGIWAMSFVILFMIGIILYALGRIK